MRLIDADALKDALRKEQRWVIKRDGYHNEGFSYDQVMFAIDEQPTIEAEPKRGRWKYVRDHIDQEHRVFECTACGQEIAFHNKYRGLETRSTPYCFHCGAKMDEVEE